MRAKEFINEAKWTKLHGTPGKIGAAASDTLPGAFVQHELRNTDPYMQYRMGVAVAAARAHKENHIEFEQESPWAENLTQIMFAPEDEETIRLASKLMGVTPTKIADNKSHEASDTANVSPVAQPKKNKYGV